MSLFRFVVRCVWMDSAVQASQAFTVIAIITSFVAMVASAIDFWDRSGEVTFVSQLKFFSMASSGTA